MLEPLTRCRVRQSGPLSFVNQISIAIRFGRPSIAWRVSSGMSHDSRIARSSSRTPHVPVGALPPPQAPRIIFRGLHN